MARPAIIIGGLLALTLLIVIIAVSLAGSRSSTTTSTASHTTSATTSGTQSVSTGTNTTLNTGTGTRTSTSTRTSTTTDFTQAVTGLTMVAATPTSVQLQWNGYSAANVLNYSVEQSLNNTTFTPVGSAVVGTTTTISGLYPSSIYFYRVRGNGATSGQTTQYSTSLLTQTAAPPYTVNFTAPFSQPLYFAVFWEPTPFAGAYVVDARRQGTTEWISVYGFDASERDGEQYRYIVPTSVYITELPRGTALDPSTAYEVRVAALPLNRDEELEMNPGPYFQTQVSTAALNAPPLRVAQEDRENGAVRFEWAPYPGAHHFLLRVANPAWTELSAPVSVSYTTAWYDYTVSDACWGMQIQVAAVAANGATGPYASVTYYNPNNDNQC